MLQNWFVIKLHWCNQKDPKRTRCKNTNKDAVSYSGSMSVKTILDLIMSKQKACKTHECNVHDTKQI